MTSISKHKMSSEQPIIVEVNNLKDPNGINDGIFDEFSLKLADEIWKFHMTIPGYIETPLVYLKDLAKELKVDKIMVKDESKRFNLNAYKFLGVSYSLALELKKNIGGKIN